MALEDRIRLPALNLIHRRSRLLNLLAEFVEAGQRLITVYAPGGYGKSILLADFAQTTDLPVCWCSLEPVDRDPASFLNLLVYSITNRFHELEADSLLNLVQQGDTLVSIRRIADLLATVGPHLIIIDDYHKAVSAGLSLALNRLLAQLPPTSTMIVAARGDLMLDTGQIIDLLLAERATGLSEEELRFTSKELQRVMRKRFGRQIDLANAAEIVRATDGNIAQILLTGHLMHAEGVLNRLWSHLGDDRQVIYSYLADEVLAKQPPALQNFMLRTAVLPDMTAPLCNQLLQITDAQARLQDLVRHDLFITEIGGGFRYHDLFAEFLRAKLAEDTALYRHISIQAGHLLAGQSRLEEAVVLFLSVQAWDETVTLLETKGDFFYDTGRALTLHHWLTQIPASELTRRPRLLLLRGQILNNDLGELEPALTFFKQAETQFEQHGDQIGAAEAQVWQSVNLRMRGQAQQGLTLAVKGVEQLEILQADQRVIAWALKNRGIAQGIVGNVSESLVDLRRALELFEALGDTYRAGICHHDLGVSLVTQGNLSGADHHYQQALRIWEAFGQANDLARTLNSLGVSLYLKGDYTQALTRFQESLEIALQIGASGRAAFAQAGLGDVYLETQKYAQALQAYALSTDLARQAGMQSLQLYNLVKQGECFYRRHHLAEALKLAGQAKEIAAETGLIHEKGLATMLQAKIYVRQGEYQASFDLFAAALACLADNDLLEQVKVRLWWGYSLWLDCRVLSAFEQLHEALRLTLAMGELLPGLGSTIAETRSLLQHFQHRGQVLPDMQQTIRLLLAQGQTQNQTTWPRLQFFAFGPAAVVIDGEYTQLFSLRGKIRKMPEFLFYLILEGRDQGCRWSAVTAALWPDLDAEKASVNFHQTIKRLRDRVFGAYEAIIVHNDYYRINPDYLAWCDVLAFQTLFERASAAVSLAAALPLYLELISLYQGEFLAGFELEEWGMTYGTRYETWFLQAVRLAAEQLLKNNQPHQALAIIHQGLAQDYFREDLHQLAAKAYARLGLYDDLVTHYQELCATFEKELGVSPTPETQHLYQHLITKRRIASSELT